MSAKGNLGGETFICKMRHLIWGRKLVGCRRSVKKGRLLGVFHEREAILWKVGSWWVVAGHLWGWEGGG